MSDRLLLDTCALIWLSEGGGRLSGSVLREIDEAARVYVSPISAWEISLKTVRGELELPLPAESWFSSVLNAHSLTLQPLNPEILIAANHLPWHHRDPADRFIIASAQSLKAKIITADRKFKDYDVEVLF